MCKYCETVIYVDYMEFHKGELVCETKYESCEIVRKDDKYYIYLDGSYEDYSESISFCPFCGRKLK